MLQVGNVVNDNSKSTINSFTTLLLYLASLRQKKRKIGPESESAGQVFKDQWWAWKLQPEHRWLEPKASLTLLLSRSRAWSRTLEALDSSSFQAGLEPLELESLSQPNMAARSPAVKPDSWRGEWQQTRCWTKHATIFPQLQFEDRWWCDVLQRHRQIPPQRSCSAVRPSLICLGGSEALCCNTKSFMFPLFNMKCLGRNIKKSFSTLPVDSPAYVCLCEKLQDKLRYSCKNNTSF